MSDMNVCIFTGRLGADPEIRVMQDGRKVANFNIAVGKSWRDRNGERQERTEWVRCTVFAEGLVKICEQYLNKGSRIAIRGTWQTRKWQDQSGQDRYTTECVLQPYDGTLTMLDSRNDGEGQQGSADAYREAGGGAPAPSMDDEIPFAPEVRI